MKLYTVISINRETSKESPPRYDLAPMNHAAACNFMDSCRTEYTDYRIHPWPDDVAAAEPPLIANGYRRDKDKQDQERAEKIEAAEWLEKDALYLDSRVEFYKQRCTPNCEWIAHRTQEAADHSRFLAEEIRKQLAQ